MNWQMVQFNQEFMNQSNSIPGQGQSNSIPGQGQSNSIPGPGTE